MVGTETQVRNRQVGVRNDRSPDRLGSRPFGDPRPERLPDEPETAPVLLPILGPFLSAARTASSRGQAQPDGAGATNQPDGQITSDLRKLCQVQNFRKSKIFPFPSTLITGTFSPSRPTQRGVGHRHNEGRVAVDADVAMDGRSKGVRQKRVVLAPVTASSFWEANADQRRRWQ